MQFVQPALSGSTISFSKEKVKEEEDWKFRPGWQERTWQLHKDTFYLVFVRCNLIYPFSSQFVLSKGN